MPDTQTMFNAESRGAHSMLFRETVSHPADFSRVAPFRLRNNPVLLLAVSFAAGILCRPVWQPPFYVVGVCVLLLVVATIAHARAARLAWPATAFAFVALGWAAALLQPSREDSSLLRYADGLQRTLEARVMTSRLYGEAPVGTTDGDVSQEDDAPEQAREVLTLRVLRIEDVTPDVATMVPSTGAVLVTLHSRNPEQTIPYLPCGARIALTVRMHPPQRYRNPGGWNYADQLEREGVSAVARADVRTLQVLQPASVPLRCMVLAAQHWSSRRITSLARLGWVQSLPGFLRFDDTDAAVLKAMLLGDRSDLDGELRTDFERTGSFHLFVVAGIHITLLTAALYFVLRRFRVSQVVALLATICLACTYAIFTGFGQPVQRALLMTIVYLLALAISRDRQVFNALGVAVLFMLMVDPQALLQASLQMTVLSVVAVGGIAAPLLNRTVSPCEAALRHIGDLSLDAVHRPRLTQIRVSLRMVGRLFLRPSQGRAILLPQHIPAWLLRGLLIALEAALMTLIAEMVMALPMAVYFHRLTPFAAPANVLALPLIGMLLGCAMLTFVLAMVHPLLAAPSLILTAVLLHVVNGTIHAFSALRGAEMRVPAPSAGYIMAALILWWVAVICLRRQASRWGHLGFAVSAAAFLLLLVPPHRQASKQALSFTAIDVGQGDSLLVTSPDGKSMVIDGGGSNGPQQLTANSRFNVGEDVVSPFLWRAGFQRIDVLAVTHAHNDHLGGAGAILRNFRPRELWLSVPSPALKDLVSEAARDHISVRYLHAGENLPLGSVQVEVVSPAATYQPSMEPSNDDSLALRFQYGNSSALAAGDAESRSEAAMMQEPVRPVTLLKVGHHGSNTSTSDAFLHTLHPQYAVISCGRDNRFGHPRLPVLQRLAAMHVKTSRTDTMGAITYLLHTDGTVQTQVLMSPP